MWWFVKIFGIKKNLVTLHEAQDKLRSWNLMRVQSCGNTAEKKSEWERKKTLAGTKRITGGERVCVCVIHTDACSCVCVCDSCSSMFVYVCVLYEVVSFVVRRRRCRCRRRRTMDGTTIAEHLWNVKSKIEYIMKKFCMHVLVSVGVCACVRTYVCFACCSRLMVVCLL